MTNYIPTIGIEVHVELKTNTKIFSNSLNGYGQMANSLTNVIDLGYPGTLPTVNEEVINLAIKAATVLNCKIRKVMHFDRKNYFYPDNPKNFQITQSRTPIGYDGYIEIEVDGTKKKIEIEEMHIEEDTCKSTHRGDKTLLDFNRAGVPLIEIVTKPCISNSKEAKLYLEKLKELLFYTGISDCKMEEGSMRCDANVSIRKNEEDPFGTKCEIKNIGSISNVGLSIEKEIIRQSKLLDANETFQEQTRRYDDKLGDTVLMRVKETGNDYRYFPEPDIPPYILEDEKIEAIKQNMPILPNKRREIYQEAGINPVNINKIIANKEISDYLLKVDGNLVIASNLLLGEIQAYLNKTGKNLLDTKLTYDKFNLLVEKLDKKEISNQVFKEIINTIMETDSDLEELIASKKQKELTLEELEKIVTEVILNNPDSITDYKLGKDRATKFLMGQIMKATKGSASPSQANEILLKKLSEQ